MMIKKHFIQISFIWLIVFNVNAFANDFINIGLNYPKTGPYYVQGLDQLRAAKMAVSEINLNGGVLGKKVKLIIRDSASDPEKTKKNVLEMINDFHVKMVFGGSSSAVAIAASEICQQEKVLFFGTLTYSTATTGIHAHRHSFRECYNSWMGAKAIAAYLNDHFSNKRYLYITSDYTWGHSTETSLRQLTDTDNQKYHIGLTIPFPNANKTNFKRSLAFANMISPDVLVLVLFGKDMETAIRLATSMGMKSKMQLVVPNLTLGMAEGAGPKVMEGVIGALPWCWQVPYQYDYKHGKKFVEAFASKFNRYPSSSGASAYTIIYEYTNAVVRAQSFFPTHIILALENHKYQLLKDEQIWRKFDHQSIQTVFAVKCKEKKYVLMDQFKQDYFEIINRISGNNAARTRDEWNRIRVQAGKSIQLEEL